MTVEQTLSDWARDAFAAAFPGADLTGADLAVVPTADPSFWDYQCNAAMGLARTLRTAPRAIPEAGLDVLREAGAHVEIGQTVETAGVDADTLRDGFRRHAVVLSLLTEPMDRPLL